ncbi:hypothetical protein PENSPDRAFT_84349 [Peniophora sp. CONT]|nr:hypothetical protein PENSPDRAFT_84349 [Peniophora sp. CONT]
MHAQVTPRDPGPASRAAHATPEQSESSCLPTSPPTLVTFLQPFSTWLIHLEAHILLLLSAFAPNICANSRRLRARCTVRLS